MAHEADSHREDELRVRNRARLPAGRLTLSVTWLRMPGIVLVTLALASLSFLVGVSAGTAGWYRETVIALAGALDEGSPLRRILLAPDRTARNTPSMRDRLSAIEAHLAAIAKRQDKALTDYDSLASAYSAYAGDVQALVGATRTLGARTDAARTASEATRTQLDLLILAVEEAQRARAEADRGQRSQQPVQE